MRYFDPMKETPEGKLLAIVRDIEKAVGIEKNYECNMGCEAPNPEECQTCGPNVKKYVQENSADNVKPMFMEISGKTEIPATGYTGNQVLPYFEDGKSRSPISEVAKMPSVSQTGYDNVNVSSMHMHYNDGGDYDYRAKVEESLAEIKKEANAGQLGILEEIVGQIEAIYSRL